jgi:amidase
LQRRTGYLLHGVVFCIHFIYSLCGKYAIRWWKVDRICASTGSSMSRFPEYSGYDGLGLAALVRRGEVTPARVGGRVVRRDRQNESRTQRHHNAAARSRGSDPRPRNTGWPFRGVPFLAKDLLISYAGVPTGGACRLFQGYTRDWDSELVRRFKKSGVATVAKTNTPELGMNAATEPVLHGPTRNPWDLSLTAGGSSGGSAAGIAPIGHASDGGGSTRIPAACVGVVGLKPSRGRNPLVLISEKFGAD